MENETQNYSAYLVGRTPHFQKDKKPIKTSEVPAEIKANLLKQLGIEYTVETEEKVEEVKEDHLTAEDFAEPVQPQDQLMEQISIHSAPLEDIAQALFERFGIYTVYLNRFPQDDEINPFTSQPMTRYEKGVAYQSFIRATSQGLLNGQYENHRQVLDQKLEAAVNIEYAAKPKNFDEERQANSFDYRTSVRGGNENPSGQSINGARTVAPDGRFDMDEPLIEPKVGGAPIIRPNW